MRAALTVGLWAIVALAGCGDDEGGDGSGESAPRTVTVAAGKPIAVTAHEYRFEPASIELGTESKGPTVVRLRLRNEGAVAHDLHVTCGDQDLGGTPIFGPGQTKTGNVSLTPGEYELVCTVGDHEALGMRGKLVLR